MIEKNITPERILYDLWSHCKLTILQLKKKKKKTGERLWWFEYPFKNRSIVVRVVSFALWEISFKC